MVKIACRCRDQCPCHLVAGSGLTMTGNGSNAQPWVLNADPLDCDDARACFSAGDGITYNQSSGEFAANLSAEADNVLEVSADGGLYVPATTVDQDVEWVFNCGE